MANPVGHSAGVGWSDYHSYGLTLDNVCRGLEDMTHSDSRPARMPVVFPDLQCKTHSSFLRDPVSLSLSLSLQLSLYCPAFDVFVSLFILICPLYLFHALFLCVSSLRAVFLLAGLVRLRQGSR